MAAIDRLLAERLAEAGVEAAAPADDLTVVRRLWLALAGTIPSLEEIRAFEADSGPGGVDRALARLLADRRSADGLARRLASALVGNEDGQFIVFRRDRFVTWLADQIHANRAWDQIVREMVAARGLWTDTPAVNFVTQAEFEGLAACFAQARLSAVGIEDDIRRVHRIEATSVAAIATPMAAGGRNVPPRVPFGDEWYGSGGTHRENLAAWIVHPDNRRFDRAIANRAWGILFGKAWHDPVDELPDPPTGPGQSDLLDLLADDFREHGRDLRRLFVLIASTKAFRQSSAHPLLESPEGYDRVAESWGAFPLTRLGPDQMIGAMVATTSLETIDRDSHLLTRLIRFFRETDFLREYGEVQDARGHSLPATIPQSLVQMNGKLAREMVEANAFTASGRIAGMARDDAARIELAFLVTLSRRPTTLERESLLPLLSEAATKGRGIEDVMWTLTNGPEFCWNH